MSRFDLYVTTPFRQEATDDGSLDVKRFSKRGWAGLNEDLAGARSLLQKLRSRQVNAYVVETKYRQPLISLQQAGDIAMKHYRDLLASGKELGPLNEGYDDIMWWTFTADDIEAQSRDLIPGMLVLAVDKLDGHLRTATEHNEWIKLSLFN